MKKYVIIILLLLPLFTNAQVITLFAGKGIGGGADGLGDGLHKDSAIIPDPVRGTFDKHGNYYFVSALAGNRIRKVDTAGIITCIAGTGASGYGGDNGPATAAKLNEPDGAILDSFGNIYIADAANNRIRKVDAATGIISTIAGNGTPGYTGDNGFATAASLNDPVDICFDKYGNLYIADYANARVRKITTSGVITTYAGNGIVGYSGDGGIADTSKIGGIAGLCADTAGNIYLADNSNSRIFKVNTAGIITTIAGTTTGYLYNGDNIPATSANIDPGDIGFDTIGNLYITETHNYRVRMIDALGIIHTVAGNGIAGYSGNGGLADTAEFNYPTGVAFDACGNLYIPESANKCIRKVTFDSTCGKADSTNAVPNIQAGGFSVYPNPANLTLTFSEGEGINSIALYNMLGQMVYNRVFAPQKKLTIDISALPAGMYFVKVNNEFVQKVVKE